MRSIEEDLEYRQAHTKLTDLEARWHAAEKRVRVLTEQIHAAIEGTNVTDRDALIQAVLNDPAAPLPGHLDIEAQRRLLTEARNERKVLDEAVRRQRTEVADIRTRLSAKLARSLAAERRRLLMEYAEALDIARQKYNAVVEQRNQAEEAGFSGAFFPVPWRGLKSPDILFRELLDDSSIDQRDRQRIEAWQAAAAKGPGVEPERRIDESAAHARRQEEMQSAQMLHLVQK